MIKSSPIIVYRNEKNLIRDVSDAAPDGQVCKCKKLEYAARRSPWSVEEKARRACAIKQRL